jgi:FAD/FMN-containing dehydrogenase
LDNSTLTEFTNHIAGDVVLPEHATYNDLRNAFVRPGSPAVIVQVRSTDDIAKAIQFAVDHQLKLSVRSGGHGFSGHATNTGGLVIDLAHYNSVEVIDSEQHLVRIGAGAKWGDVAKQLAEHGLALSSGDTNSVGVGGLTLGGGIGWLVRKHGLTIDSLVRAEIITADGQTLSVSEKEHPDLFWAIRGGGGNFGVVTSFDFRTQPVKTVVGGMAIYGIDETKSALTKWAEVMRNAPEELNSTFILFSGFGPDFPPQNFVYICYVGDDDEKANAAIQPLLQLGEVKHQDIKRKPYYEMIEDAAPPPNMQPVSESGFVKTLGSDVIDAIASNFGKAGTPFIQVRSLGGAVARVSHDATAFAHRDYEAVVWMTAMLPGDIPREDANRVRLDYWQHIRSFVKGAYINFLSEVDNDAVSTAYPAETYARLADIKATYDPNNVFNQNHNVKPKVAEPAS